MIRIGLIAVALAVGPGPAHADCTLGVMATLAITMEGTRPTTTAQINGADVPFLVDSGAFYSVITPGNARQFGLHLTAAPYGLFMQGIGGRAEVMVTTVNAFGFAGHSLPKVQFLVGGSEVGGDNGGVIGDNILSIGDTEYDLAHGMVRLIKPHQCPRTAFPFWVTGGAAYSEIDIEPGVGHRATKVAATATINDARVRVQFDTGASTSLITRAAAARAGIDVTGPGAVAAGFTSGFGRKLVRTWIVPVASFKIGTEEVRKTRLRVIETIGGGSDEPDMLLGADFFLSHHIYVANSLHRLYFTYNGGNVFNLKPVEAAGTDTPPPIAGTAASPAAADEPQTAEALARRGAASAGRREFGRAVADLTRALALAPDEPRYLAERARAYAGNRQPFLAMADLDAALKLRPNDVPTLVTRAGIRLSGRDTAGARADLVAADAAAPREADIRFQIGELFERIDALPAAIGQFDLWLAAHRDDVKTAAAYNARCWARALLGTELDLAAKDCAAALRLDAKNITYLDSRGLVRLRQGDLVHAEADYDSVLGVNPKVAWSLYGRGIARLRRGATAEGNADVAAALVVRPDLATFARAHGVEPPPGSEHGPG